MLSIDFSGKTAIVTGAGGGIGKGIAKQFAKAGATVYLADLNEEMAKKNAQEFVDAGCKAKGYALDVTKKDDIYAFVDKVAEKEGKIDYLVTAAGILISKPFMETTEEELIRHLNVNLVSVNNTCQAVLNHMIPKKSGAIVNIASASSRMGSASISHYSTSKFGVLGITQSIAMAVAKDNIRVNSICPGLVKTLIMERLVQGTAKLRGITEEEMWDAYTKGILLQRLQTPEDIGNAAAFLCSDLACNVTGQSLNVCGGMRFN